MTKGLKLLKRTLRTPLLLCSPVQVAGNPIQLFDSGLDLVHLCLVALQVHGFIRICLGNPVFFYAGLLKSEIDTVEKKSAVTIRPKPAFRPIVEVATTCQGSGISLINQTPQTQESQGNDSHGDSCNLEPQGMKT